MTHPPKSPPGFAPGQMVAGRYRLDRELGRGGMGVVMAATDLMGHGRVALKLLDPSAVADREMTERFAREARALQRVRSDHVVRVHQVGATEAGVPFFAMEHLEGQDLGDVLARGELAIATAVDYAVQICAGLVDVHREGTVHRDLKPRNLFVTRDAAGPLVKIIDFGIASRSKMGASSALTVEDMALGTPLFMSPEQLRSSANVDARADLWSLGVVLYRMLTKARPWASNNLPDFVVAVATRAPTPIRAHRHDVPPQLEAVLESCLERDLAKRVPSALELARRLGPLGGPATAARVARLEAAEKARAWGPVGAPAGPISLERTAPIDMASAEFRAKVDLERLARAKPLAQLPLHTVALELAPALAKSAPPRELGPQRSSSAAPMRPRARWSLGKLLLVMALAATTLGALGGYIALRMFQPPAERATSPSAAPR